MNLFSRNITRGVLQCISDWIQITYTISCSCLIADYMRISLDISLLLICFFIIFVIGKYICLWQCSHMYSFRTNMVEKSCHNKTGGEGGGSPCTCLIKFLLSPGFGVDLSNAIRHIIYISCLSIY